MANFQLQDSQKVTYAIYESDKDGNIDAPGPGDTVVVSSASPASLSVVADAVVDPAKVPNNPDGTPGDVADCLQTGFLVGGAKIAAGLQVLATFSHADGSAAPAPVNVLVDIVVGAAVTGSISLGAPVSQ
jgi:hypothetical protein